ncbi:BREX system serine/threonine kinase PglW [Actinomadura sp. DSM 109109]|nr:BREX system serine/threonine kinase PglW [Actinomadura lepetitiana]
MLEGRWTTVTESQFEHERRGLDAIRERLPDGGPWHAWSNFTFTANTGHIREVDLLVIAPGGVHMIELKDWHGRLATENGTWVQTTPSGRRVSHGNPLHLVNQKAKELAGLLTQNGERVWVGAGICFTDAALRVRLPVGEQRSVYTIDELETMLRRPPSDERRRIDGPRARAIKTALERVGIRRSEAEFKVGPYLLDRSAFDTGPTWADYFARHNDLREPARVRIYLSERGADASIRRSVENAARREAAVLQRFRHPGVVQLKQYDPSGHSAGPALIFDYHPDTLRLDEYLVRYGDKLGILDRMALVRQLAETVRSAHSSRIHHRALAARSIHVIPRPRRRDDPSGDGDARWLSPMLQISDWQIATQRTGSAGATRFAPTRLSAIHLSDGSDAYLAPELTAVNPDAVALDVYGLGVLTYLLATGRPPGSSQAEVLGRLETGDGLRPSGVVDGLLQDIDDLVQAATAFRPERRLATVDEFLEMLECVEDALTTPTGTTDPGLTPVEPSPEKDPLEAVPGDVLAGRWEVRRRLGTGSTSRAFLVRDLSVGADGKGGRVPVVLKVALSDARAAILVREAEVMRRLRADSRVIRLVEPEPLTIGGRTVLALEYVGDERFSDEPPGTVSSRHRQETVARELRERGRLQIDQLEAYGDYLFGAVDFLEGEGVWHRDIKPDNIAIRIRPNRTRELVLIDFSLAGYPVQEVDAGTDGYLDPFIGGLTRSVYDAHAERYAVAITLHQMASGELPKWGDGKAAPRQLDPQEWPYPNIAADAFDPNIRDSLVAFFRKALHRDAEKRFPELKPMRDAWKKIFLDLADRTPSTIPGSRHPVAANGKAGEAGIADAEPATAEQERDRLAGQATRDTHLSAAGLTPTAESFLFGLGVTTVGELLEYSRRNLVNGPGLGPKTRAEIQRRQREWAERLGRTPQSPLTPEGRKVAAGELKELKERSVAEAALADGAVTSEQAGALAAEVLRAASLDALAALLVPKLKPNGSNRNEVESMRLLLRLPDEGGTLPDVPLWPTQTKVADAVGITPGRVPQMLREQRRRWRREPVMQELCAEILELLAGFGRIASAMELAEVLTVRRGTRFQHPALRRAMGLAAVRAVVEAEQFVPEESAFRHFAKRDDDGNATNGGLLALEVGEDDGPDTPSAPGLQDYAFRLGRVADRLAGLSTLPTAGTVLTELGAISPPPGTIDWDERRTVEVAVAASKNAAVTPRLEIYPRDLSLVRALRLAQAGLVPLIAGVPEEYQPGLPAGEIHERVLTRFPRFNDSGNRLPTGGALTRALQEAGFDLTLSERKDTRTHRYLPTNLDLVSSYVSGPGRRRQTRKGGVTRYATDPQMAAAAEAEERLEASVHRDGFRVLTVRAGLTEQAVEELTGSRFGAEPLSVTALFLRTLHDLVPPGTKPTWETILRADVAEPGSKAAGKFSEYARTAWGRVEPAIRERMAAGSGPLLLTDTAVFARYQAMGVLSSLAAAARMGGRGLWLLCPQGDPFREPRLGTTAVPYQDALGEWIKLPDPWVTNLHRAA